MSINQSVDVINKLRANGKLTDAEYSEAVSYIVNSTLDENDIGYYDD